jgi:hypothetical protein
MMVTRLFQQSLVVELQNLKPGSEDQLLHWTFADWIIEEEKEDQESREESSLLGSHEDVHGSTIFKPLPVAIVVTPDDNKTTSW